MTEVVCAILKRPDDLILLVQRSADMKHPYSWEFPGGKVEAGESHWEALQRELSEELEIEVQNPQPLKSVTWAYGSRVIVLQPIICELRGGKLQLKEHCDGRWLSLEQMSAFDILDADREIIEQLINLRDEN